MINQNKVTTFLSLSDNKIALLLTEGNKSASLVIPLINPYNAIYSDNWFEFTQYITHSSPLKNINDKAMKFCDDNNIDDDIANHLFEWIYLGS